MQRSFTYLRWLTSVCILLFVSQSGTVLAGVKPPPDITVTCDYWFPLDTDDPNKHIAEYDRIFGKVVKPNQQRNKIYIDDRVCPSHPRFPEFDPGDPFADPCYGTIHHIYWGMDGYMIWNFPFLLQRVRLDLTCGQGRIYRDWGTFENGGFTVQATQTITIIRCDDFFVPKQCWTDAPGAIGDCVFLGNEFKKVLVAWPCDIEISGCTPPNSADLKPENLPSDILEEDRRPQFYDDRCSMMASTYQDWTFEISGGCTKILRRWEVTDWCLWDMYKKGLYQGEYRWTWTQTIKLANGEAPVIETPLDTVLCITDLPANPSQNTCSGTIQLVPDIYDDCTPTKELLITWKLDIGNNQTYDLMGASNTVQPVSNPSNLPLTRFPADEPLLTATLPTGKHRVLWYAEDRCGNSSTFSQIIEVKDCKPPTPKCHFGLATATMEDGTLTMNANCFILTAYDNCTPTPQLRYSFSTNPVDSLFDIDCNSNVPLNGKIPLWVYTHDLDGNYSRCKTFVYVNCALGFSTDPFDPINHSLQSLELTPDLTIGHGKPIQPGSFLPSLQGKVFPNPATDELSLRLDATLDQTAEWQWFSADGKLLDSRTLNLVKGSNRIDLSELTRHPQGSYFWRINTQEGVLTGTLLLQH